MFVSGVVGVLPFKRDRGRGVDVEKVIEKVLA
jgi:hypothetical protein